MESTEETAEAIDLDTSGQRLLILLPREECRIEKLNLRMEAARAIQILILWGVGVAVLTPILVTVVDHIWPPHSTSHAHYNYTGLAIAGICVAVLSLIMLAAIRSNAQAKKRNISKGAIDIQLTGKLIGLAKVFEGNCNTVLYACRNSNDKDELRELRFRGYEILREFQSGHRSFPNGRIEEASRGLDPVRWELAALYTRLTREAQRQELVSD